MTFHPMLKIHVRNMRKAMQCLDTANANGLPGAADWWIMRLGLIDRAINGLIERGIVTLDEAYEAIAAESEALA